MPYNSIQDAEKTNPGLAKYSEKAKRGWLSSFNSCMEDGGDESKCFAIAYSVANKVDGGKKSALDLAKRLVVIAKEIISMKMLVLMLSISLSGTMVFAKEARVASKAAPVAKVAVSVAKPKVTPTPKPKAVAAKASPVVPISPQEAALVKARDVTRKAQADYEKAVGENAAVRDVEQQIAALRLKIRELMKRREAVLQSDKKIVAKQKALDGARATLSQIYRARLAERFPDK